MYRGKARLVAMLVAACALAGAAAAQEPSPEAVVGGRVVDSAEQPAVGYRVVFRVPGTAEVYLSTPTDDEGNYQVTVPSGRSLMAVAALAPSGERIELENQAPVPGQSGGRLDIVLGFALGSGAGAPTPEPPFPGADRLFRAFVEDAVFVGDWLAEGLVEYDDFESGDALGVELLGAVSFESLPRFEYGGRLGFVSADFEGAGSESGLGDLEAWAKFDLGRPIGPATHLAVGALLTVPTGDSDAGIGQDAYSSKLFAAARWSVAPFLVSAHAGVRFTGDGEVAGETLDGKVAPAAGIAAILPRWDRLALVGELTYEGERFDAAEAESLLLFGANWSPFDVGHLRFAAGAGLTAGAPDFLVIAGWTFEP